MSAGAAAPLAAAAAAAARAKPARAAKAWEPVKLDASLAIEELATPALLLDLDAFERNLERMAAHSKATKVGLRPHAKTHKCPIVAKRQMALGAVGICCAKVSEGEAMADAGLQKILLTSPVASPDKVARIVALAKRLDELIVVVDHPDGVAELDRAARQAGKRIHVAIDLDTGTRRTGIAPGEPAAALASAIAGAIGLVLRGIQAYAGHVMHVPGHAARAAASKEALGHCLETRALLARAGIEAELLSVGGTGTFDIDSGVEGVTDLQVGSYCFMDVQYRQIGDRDSNVFDYFEPSLFVLTTAISQPVKELITVDAGFKAFAHEPEAKPEFADLPGMIYHYGGDEHGIVQFTGDARPLQRGDKARMIVSHCDPTVNLYDFIQPYRDGRVSELWPITARGRSQ